MLVLGGLEFPDLKAVRRGETEFPTGSGAGLGRSTGGFVGVGGNTLNDEKGVLESAHRGDVTP